MANNRIPRVPVREQDPQVRATNFDEVCYGYNAEEAMLEASRCLHCRNPRCVTACPVTIDIPDFIAALHAGEFRRAADIIARDSSLPLHLRPRMPSGDAVRGLLHPGHQVRAGSHRQTRALRRRLEA